MTELKRASRWDEADAMLKDAVASAKSPIEIASYLNSIIDRNDFPTTMTLLNRLSDLRADPAYAAALKNPGGGNQNSAQRMLNPEGVATYISKVMDKRVQQKQIKDVLTLWDWYVPMVMTRREQQKTANKRSSSSNQNQRNYLWVWRNNSQQYEELDFPQANDQYDQNSIQVLRQLFACCKEHEAINDLVGHFQQRLADTKLPANDKSYWKFGLGYLQWWQDEKDETARHIHAGHR